MRRSRSSCQLGRDRLTYALILACRSCSCCCSAMPSTPIRATCRPPCSCRAEPASLAPLRRRALANTAYFDITHQARSAGRGSTRCCSSGEVQFAVTIPADFTRRRGARRARPDPGRGRRHRPHGHRQRRWRPLAGLPSEALSHDLVGAAGRPRRARPAVRGGRAPPLQSGGHHRLQHRARACSASILSLTLVMMTALGITRERERGTMESLLATPVQPLEVMVGKLAPYVVVGLLQVGVILTWPGCCSTCRWRAAGSALRSAGCCSSSAHWPSAS